MLLKLIGRHPCELCELMHEGLAYHPMAHRFDVVSVDVDSDPVLTRRYGLRVPVLLDAWDELICEGRLDAVALDEAVQAFAARQGKAR